MRRIIVSIGLFLVMLAALHAQEEVYQYKKQLRISTGANELAAVPFENKVVYSTPNKSTGLKKATDQQGRDLVTMFEFSPAVNSKSIFYKPFTTERHEGIPSFTSDFKTMVFCQMERKHSGDEDAMEKGQVPLKLFFSENLNGAWSKPVEYEYNRPDALLFSPCLSPGGDTLFFAANFSEGYGGFDIYWSRKVDGAWTEPENLGPGVNTEEHELYPSFHPLGQLYFSSLGHDGGKDGFDLFETRCMDGEWKKASRLPEGRHEPNSQGNDMHIWFAPDMKSGYLTTDYRSGSKDIWTFSTDIPDLPEEIKPIKKTYYKYRIYDRKLDTVDTELFRYSWTINDTLEIPGHDIIYRFPKPGIYECKLNVFDLQLDTLLEGQTVKTLPIRLNVQAVISCPDTVRVNEPVNFDGSQTHLPGVPEQARMYYWDFGDTYRAMGEKVEHSFGFPGTYRVVLNVDEETRRGASGAQKRYANYRDIIVVE